MADSIPTFNIGGKYFPASQLADKSLYARKTLTRSDYDGFTTATVTIQAGELVGKMYSWNTQNGKVFFAMYGKYPFTNSVLYEADAFSLSAIEAQGAKTEEEIAAEKAAAEADATKTPFQKLLDSLGITNLANTLKWAIPLFAIGYLGIRLYSEKTKADSYRPLKQLTDGK